MERGEAIFNGEVLPSDEVVELIGKLGIDFIIKTLEETLKKHKELFGDSSPKTYGMSPYQRFFDLQERIILDVKALTERPEGTHINDYKQDFSIEIGEKNEILLARRHEPSDNTTRRLVKTGWY